MTYPVCPKCGHAPLPADQTFPAGCPACGLVLAKFSDGHDWINIFGDLGLLLKARSIGVFFGLVGKAMMCAGLAWAAYMVWLQKAQLSDSPLAESDESRE